MLHSFQQVKENLSVALLQDFLQEVAAMDHQDNDCLICVVMSHGADDKIYASDCKHIALSGIVQIFKECRQLHHKPKLFFTQACRGGAPQSQNQSATISTGIASLVSEASDGEAYSVAGTVDNVSETSKLS